VGSRQGASFWKNWVIDMQRIPISLDGLRLLNRRGFLNDAAGGLASVALAAMLGRERLLAADPLPPIRPTIEPTKPLAARVPHHAAKAKRVLMIFCSGACSHLETWDYKPSLEKYDGKPMPGTEQLKTFQSTPGALTRSRYPFKRRGECGKYTSELLPQMGELVDDMCFIHSMTSRTNTHGPGENFMSTGFTIDGFPSIGAWTTYALGSEADNLPAFVAIPDPRGVPQAGPNNWSSGFLPAVFQGTPFNAQKPISHLARPSAISGATDDATRGFLQKLNEKHLARNPGDTQLAARISSYELAARLQQSAPGVADLSQETAETIKAYGADRADPNQAGFARNCILARRLLENGVRFVQLFNGAYAMGEGVGNWDGHKTLKDQYDVHGPILDRPAAALLKDLKQRGMLEDTLVVWTTEFGRMPFFQAGASGRDHNPHGFTCWMAGAGVKAPYTYGATDEFGYKAADKPSIVYDLHATILHLLGLDHERLTFAHNGTERRLTDVHGHVLSEILA
jgi:hypothetical protein